MPANPLRTVTGSTGRSSDGRQGVGARSLAEIAESGALALATVLASPFLRRAYNHWGATRSEEAAPMPGDDLVPVPQMESTRGITIEAPPERVWQWLVQLGQGRGGFYSYDALENLFGCGIRSATQVEAVLQGLAVGDIVRLAPGQAPCYRVARVEPPQALVLVGSGPEAGSRSRGPASLGPVATTWQWTLRPLTAGTATRLLSRQRYTYPRRQSLLWRLVEPVDFVMERRMLLGIRARAECSGTEHPMT